MIKQFLTLVKLTVKIFKIINSYKYTEYCHTSHSQADRGKSHYRFPVKAEEQVEIFV